MKRALSAAFLTYGVPQVSHFHHALSLGLYSHPSNDQIPPKELIYMTAQRIETGNSDSDALGFSERLFSGWLERYEDNRLYLHFIISRERNKGHTQALLQQWLSEGYDVRVVMPRPVMQHILKKFHFVPSRERISDHYEDDVEVWYRPGVGHLLCSPLIPGIQAGTG
jgi:hypothetical protein